MRTTTSRAPEEVRNQRLGVQFATVSAVGYGLGGPFSTSLMGSGWTPASVVFFRCLIATAILALPAWRALRRSGIELRSHLASIVSYGLVAVLGCQLSYAGGLRHMSVSVTLLVVYAAPVLVIGYLWARYRVRPGAQTAAGTITALLGLALLLGLTSTVQVSGIGMAWAASGAICTATYFLMNANVDRRLPPVVLIAGGLAVGAAGLGLACLVGVLPWGATALPAELGGRQVSSWILILVMGSALTALPYMTGIASARLVGSRVASFIAMSEVLFATLFAWLLLGQVMSPTQAVGGLVLLAGVVIIKLERVVRDPAAPVGL